jgi:hypothetical protein
LEKVEKAPTRVEAFFSSYQYWSASSKPLRTLNLWLRLNNNASDDEKRRVGSVPGLAHCWGLRLIAITNFSLRSPELREVRMQNFQTKEHGIYD